VSRGTSRFPSRGLVYLNNRYHDPTLSAFISVDPLVVQTGEPYIYAGANPVGFSDPSGLGKCAGAANSFDGYCFTSLPDGGKPVVGPDGTDYGTVGVPAEGTGGRDGGSLPVTYVPAMVAPPCPSLGPSADACSVPVPEQWLAHGTGSGQAKQELVELIASALPNVVWSLFFGGPGPGLIDQFARDELVEYARGTAVYTCGTSASGASVTCVDSQRIPSMQTADAVTFGHYIFCQDQCDSDLLLAHELVHVRQYEVNGDSMAMSYLWQTVRNGYRENPYEVEAFNVGNFLKGSAW